MSCDLARCSRPEAGDRIPHAVNETRKATHELTDERRKRISFKILEDSAHPTGRAQTHVCTSTRRVRAEAAREAGKLRAALGAVSRRSFNLAAKTADALDNLSRSSPSDASSSRQAQSHECKDVKPGHAVRQHEFQKRASCVRAGCAASYP